MALGIPVGELMERMSSHEFLEWQAYRRIRGPFSSEQFYLGMGVIAASIYNSQRTKKSDPMLNAMDFVPKFYESKKELEAKQEQNIAAFLANIGAPPPPPKPKDE